MFVIKALYILTSCIKKQNHVTKIYKMICKFRFKIKDVTYPIQFIHTSQHSRLPYSRLKYNIQ